MQRFTVATTNAPAAIGPYSQACGFHRLLFCSGQIALDPATGELAASDVETQTRRVMENLKGVLEAGGACLASVMKTTVYLKNLVDFQAVNAIYAEYFEEHPPARATVEVARLPKDALIEIDAIALRLDD